MNDRIGNTIHSKNVRHAGEILRTVCAVLAVSLQCIVLFILLSK